MRSVEAIADEIIAREGGFVNDPDDPGGATKHGVTIHTLRRLGLDLDRDGRVTVADVRRVTRATARLDGETSNTLFETLEEWERHLAQLDSLSLRCDDEYFRP